MPPGKITSIAAQAHDSQRVNLFIDGQFAIGLSLATLAQERLYIGQELDELAWLRVEAAAEAERAMSAAARLLDARPRSSAEVRQRLRRKDFTPAAIEQALERLSALGLLDDAVFSRYWVENRQSFRPRGANALRDELRRKGVARDTIAEALAATDADPEGEAARAEAVARSALRRYAASPDRSTFQRRLGGLLQRRGFSLHTIRPILAIL
ncbi:MAG: RecX family transcriptional regulator [Chloroflexales bacterium]